MQVGERIETDFIFLFHKSFCAFILVQQTERSTQVDSKEVNMSRMMLVKLMSFSVVPFKKKDSVSILSLGLCYFKTSVYVGVYVIFVANL